MFKTKDGVNVARIQDALQCCGFKGVQDMAFPFPDHSHGSDACVVRYERDEACIEPWRTMERKVAIILLVVPVAVFLWKVALFVALEGGDAGWLPSAIRLPRDGEGSGEARIRPAITFRDVEEEGEADSLREEVTRLNQDSNLATHVVGNSSRVRPSPLIQQESGENMWARD